MKPSNSSVVLLAVCALLWQQTSCGGSPKIKGPVTMNDNQNKMHQVLALENAAYFNVSGEEKQKLELAISNALSAGSMFSNDAPQTTYAIALSDTIDSDNHKEIPMLLGAQETGLRRWEVSRALNTHIVLVNKNTGEVTTERFADDPPGKRMVVPPPSQSDPKPSNSDQRAVSSGIQKINLEPYFKLLNKTGQYSVAVIVYDHASNTQSFNVKKNGKAGIAPETASVVSSFIKNVKETPAYGQESILLSLNNADSKKAVTATCRVSLGRREATIVDGKDDQKLLPISLLLFKLDEEIPVKIDFYVPIIDADKKSNISMEWQLDIEKLVAEGITLQGKYYGYLVSGVNISSPVLMDF